MSERQATNIAARESERACLEGLIPRLDPGTTWRWDEPMAKHTTLRVGGPVDMYVEPASEPELQLIVRWCGDNRVPLFILGRGSNLLVKDLGLRGVVACLAHPAFGTIQAIGNVLHCGAGARLKAVATTARDEELTGLEFLEGIPGTIGGALRMNAGAMGAAVFERVERVRLMGSTGEVYERSARQLAPQYRSCPAIIGNIVLGADLVGARGQTRTQIRNTMDAYSSKRWSSQPASPSAGCVFKNPITVPAGRLIDELGLKGMRIGGAMVSLEHGNFIVNHGGATAGDVLQLIEALRERARKERGIELETEVEIIGE